MNKLINETYLKNLINEKTYDEVLWDYQPNLIQIIKQKENDQKKSYNLIYNNLKEKFDIMVFLNENEIKIYCNCEQGKNGKNCVHQIWAGLKINENNEKEMQLNQLNDKVENKLINLAKIGNFQNNADEIVLNLSLQSTIEQETKVNYKLTAGIKNKKQYIITDILQFITNVLAKKKLNYGKEFNTDNYFLIKKDLNILKTLEYIYLKNKNKIQRINEIDKEDLADLFQYYVNSYLEYNQEQYLIKENLQDINLNINKIEDDLEIVLNSYQNYQVYAPQIYINKNTHTFYLVNEHDIYKVQQLHQLTGNLAQNQQIIKIKKENTTELLQQILPTIYNEFIINLDPRLNIEIVEEQLNIKFYCYYEHKIIYFKPVFTYGEYQLEKHHDNKLIKRDLEQENKTINFLKQDGYDYDINRSEFYIKNERLQFNFLTKNLFKLKEKFEVEIDDKLKNIIINFDSNNINLSINQIQSEEYFEVDYNLEIIESKEINEIITSFEQKREFHKLENDIFLKLTDQKVYEQLLFLRNINKNKEHNLNTYRVPKYKALQIYEETKHIFNKTTMNQEFINYIESIKLISPINPEELKNQNYELRNYQKKGVSWLNNLYQASLGALLADEMGLGKTLQIISFLRYQQIQQGLIVMPKALLYNWEEEFKKFNPSQKIQIIEGSKEKRTKIIKNLDHKTITLIGYTTAIQDIELLKQIRFDVLVIDEAQYIKNPITKTAKNIKKIQAKFYIALTGTPIENNQMELWSIFDFLMPDYLGNLKEFTKKYKDLNNSEKLILLQKITAPFILRRLKKDVLKELPEKIITNLYVDLEEEQGQIYNQYAQKSLSEIDKYIQNNNYKNKSMEILAAITRLRQLAIDPGLVSTKYKNKSSKINIFEELVQEIIQNNQKVLIFSQYTTHLKKLQKILEEKEIKNYYLDGNTRPKQRLMDVERFNKNNIPVYLISLKAGGIGLNLTAAENVIIMDPWWNPSVENQAIDRTHRIGQKNKIQVFKIITKNTIEEKILKLQENKKDIINKILDNEHEDITKLNTEQLIELLKI